MFGIILADNWVRTLSLLEMILYYVFAYQNCPNVLLTRCGVVVPQTGSRDMVSHLHNDNGAGKRPHVER